MAETITIGLDIAKSVFQVHGVDAAGAAVLRKQLRRTEGLPFFGRFQSARAGPRTLANLPRISHGFHAEETSVA